MNICYLIDRNAVERPQATAVLHDDGPPMSWLTFAERVGKLAAAIAARGVTAGDRVALLAPNGRAFLEVTMAAARIGAVIVPLNYRLSAAELAFQLDDAECALWFVEESFAALAEATDIDVPRIAITADGGELEAMIAGADGPVELVPLSGDHTLGIFYTGGTTGLPKGVMLTHQNMLSNANHLAPAMEHGPSDIHLHAAPMFHLADLGSTFAQLLAGGAHCFLPRFDGPGACAMIERHKVTTIGLPPTMLDMTLRGDACERHDLSSLRRINYGGSPITDAVLKRAFAVLPCDLMQGYGQTEATQVITLLPPEDHRRAVERPELLRTCGKPAEGVMVIIGDPDDRPVKAGEVGELLVRGPNVMKGYWRRETETAEALRNGWLHTGDLGRRDAEGYITLVDRRKDMIITGAENVFSTEVENAVTSHPDVVEAAVVGVPDEKYGERVHAVVVLKDGAPRDEEALKAHCRELIGGFKIPRSFEFIAELPKTGAGKVRKAELRAPHWEGRDRKVG